MDPVHRFDGPPAARLLRDFVNTREPQVGTDELATPAAVAAWFAAHGMSPGPLEARDVGLVVDLREGLRALFLGHAGHDLDVPAVDRINQVLAQFPARLELGPDSCVVRAGTTGPLAGPVAGIADAVRHCREDGSWPRLKACARDTCRWVFHDASRNQARRWCSMEGCGNHVKMKRAYARRTSS
jgi:predicted RNA-binding Zn ribbon-like protein